MPNGLTEDGTKAAADIYYSHLLFYPYQVYINWTPKEEGNILYNDKKFVTLLYQWNNDYFTEYSKVSDAGSYVKGSIYEFIESSEKVVIVVDCENSDPYKLCATLRNLDRQYTKKISSIILFDDVHAASAWRILESFTAIPVEHMMIERVKQNKSLVDVMLISRTCQEHYKTMWIPSSLCQATQTTGADFVSARCPFSCHDRTGKLRARLEKCTFRCRNILLLHR